MKRKFVCVKQQDLKDCGPACLSMVSRYYGLSVAISKIREIAGTDLEGTNVQGLIESGEKLGFEVKGVKATDSEALNEIPLPAIAHVVMPGGLLHYVVVYKIKKQKIYVADPAEGLVVYSKDDFCKIWTGILVLLVPSQNFQRGNKNVGTLSRFLVLLKTQKSLLFPIFLASIF